MGREEVTGQKPQRRSKQLEDFIMGDVSLLASCHSSYLSWRIWSWMALISEGPHVPSQVPMHKDTSAGVASKTATTHYFTLDAGFIPASQKLVQWELHRRVAGFYVLDPGSDRQWHNSLSSSAWWTLSSPSPSWTFSVGRQSWTQHVVTKSKCPFWFCFIWSILTKNCELCF